MRQQHFSDTVKKVSDYFERSNYCEPGQYPLVPGRLWARGVDGLLAGEIVYLQMDFFAIADEDNKLYVDTGMLLDQTDFEPSGLEVRAGLMRVATRLGDTMLEGYVADISGLKSGDLPHRQIKRDTPDAVAAANSALPPGATVRIARDWVAIDAHIDAGVNGRQIYEGPKEFEDAAEHLGKTVEEYRQKLMGEDEEDKDAQAKAEDPETVDATAENN